MAFACIVLVCAVGQLRAPLQQLHVTITTQLLYFNHQVQREEEGIHTGRLALLQMTLSHKNLQVALTNVRYMANKGAMHSKRVLCALKTCVVHM